jgi:hypothetical protein
MTSILRVPVTPATQEEWVEDHCPKPIPGKSARLYLKND